MSRSTKDPLLNVASVILALGVVLFIFVAAMVLIGLGAVLTVQRAELLARLAEAGAPDSAYWAIVVVLVLVEALMIIALRFVLELSGIVKSVGRGDPFEPANADRLWRMGWLTVAAHAAAIPAGAIGVWIKSVSGEAGKTLDVEINLGSGGVLLILTLFILARVFRHGAVMREDLEGTV